MLKRLRASFWRTRDISIGGKNPTNINFANIGDHGAFIDTIKCFQQSLAILASKLTDKEKSAIWKECGKLIRKDKNLCRKFELCSAEDQEYVLGYLSIAKGTIWYEMMTRYDSQDVAPVDEKFFLPYNF